MSDKKRKLLYVVIFALFVISAGFQSILEPMYMTMQGSQIDTNSSTRELMVQLPGQFLIASFAGFKEVIAGALWVRADDFFHSGQYEAIIPIVRLVTWLDPNNIDVFTTGAWHMDYNFTDEQSRSDKRMIPASIALLREGIKNNSNRWDLYFELGWAHYNRKLDDHANTVKYIEMACTKQGFDPNTGKEIDRPEFVDRMLAHAYEANCEFDKAIKQWYVSIKRAEELDAKSRKKGEPVGMSTAVVTAKKNLAALYLRMAWRYGDMDAYKKGIELGKTTSLFVDWAQAGAEKDYAARMASGNYPKDALRSLNPNFTAKWKKVAPKIIEISGTIDMIKWSEYKDLASEVFTHSYQNNLKGKKEGWRDGCRVKWMLTDLDYKMEDMQTFNYKIDRSKLATWDTAYIKKGTFSTKIDMSKNPSFYPFNAEKYKLTVWYSPENNTAPDFTQDRIGWRGEAFQSKDVNTTFVTGRRIVKKEFIISRDELVK